MKKWLPILLLSIMMVFTGCGDSTSSTPPKPAPHVHTDVDADDICDTCFASLNNQHVHVDTNSDEICDTCFTSLHTHVDKDNNGQCDVCNPTIDSTPSTVTIDFYSVNDLHGKFDDTYANMGVNEMSAFLRSAQTANENTVLLSAGDMWQGSAESNYTKGKLITEWMNEMNFSAMTLGNHEYDWGEAFIQTNEQLAQFPFLGINIYESSSNSRVEYCQPSTMIERSGVKIGIVGAIGDCYSSIASEQVSNIYFKTGNELTSLVKAESQKLRNEGAQVIVYVIHDSTDTFSEYYDESLSNGYVDLVFEGHSHQSVQKTDSYGVWHLQAGGDNNTGISHAQISVNTKTNTVSVNTAQIIQKESYQAFTGDPIVDTLLEKYADELTEINEVLGTNASYRNSSALANYAAKAYFAIGKARWGNNPTYKGKIVLGGGFISVRSPYYLPAGQVTYGDLYPLFTFDNPLVLCKISGSRLNQQFLNDTSGRYYNYYGEDGESIIQNISSTATYYVVVDTYCANFNFEGMGYLEIVEYFDDTQTYFSRNAIVDYTRAGGLSSSPPSPESFVLDNNTGGNSGGNSGTGGNNTDTTQYTSISTIRNSSSALSGITAKGVVVAVAKTGFMFWDGTGMMLYYSPSSEPAVEIGDKVVISGKTNIYANNQQFSASNATFTIKDVDVPTYTASTPEAWGDSEVEAYNGNVGSYVTVTGSFYKTSSYFNAQKLSTSASHQLSILEPTSDVLGSISITSTAQTLTITGYTCYLVNSRYVYLVPVSVSVGGSTSGGTSGGSSGGTSGGTSSTQTKTLSFTSSFGGSGISEYKTGNYGSAKIDSQTFEYYRAYKPSDTSEYIMQLLPYLKSTSDGTQGGSLYNTTPLYGIQSISITYKCDADSMVYTGDDRIASMTAYTLPAASSYQTKTLTINTDNFFSVYSETAILYVKALSITYNNASVSYNSSQSASGTGDYRLNAVRYTGTLVAGSSSVAVPVSVVYDGGSCQILQTKTYTYYTLDYVSKNPSVKSKAAMLTPQDVAAYYNAFSKFPANYAQKNFSSWNEWDEVEDVFGDDTRYVSKYSRTTGYAQYVPYISSANVYYEFDIQIDYYAKNSRSVGRVVGWESGWNVSSYSSAPVCVYTDDHYATFQEYLNDGTFGARFDAEMRLNNVQWSAATTIAI